MYSVDLSHYNTPILLDIYGREHIFNKDNQIIRINEIGYFTKDELKNMTKEELIAEYERLNDKYVIAEVVKKGLQEEVDRLYEVKLDLETQLMENGWAEYVDDKLITIKSEVNETLDKIYAAILRGEDPKDTIMQLKQELEERYD